MTLQQFIENANKARTCAAHLCTGFVWITIAKEEAILWAQASAVDGSARVFFDGEYLTIGCPKHVGEPLTI